MKWSINYINLIAYNNIKIKLNTITQSLLMGVVKIKENLYGSLNYERVPTDGCSKIYAGDIEIRFQNVIASQISHEHEDEDLVEDNEEPRSTSPSPLELQEVDQIKKKEEEEVPQQEPIFLEGSLSMDENKIQEALNILHGTHDLVSKKFWSMEEKYSMEDIEKIQKAISNIKGNFFNVLSNRDYLIELVHLYHGLTLNNVEDNDKLSNELEFTENALQNYMRQIEQLQNR